MAQITYIARDYTKLNLSQIVNVDNLVLDLNNKRKLIRTNLISNQSSVSGIITANNLYVNRKIIAYNKEDNSIINYTYSNINDGTYILDLKNYKKEVLVIVLDFNFKTTLKNNIISSQTYIKINNIPYFDKNENTVCNLKNSILKINNENMLITNQVIDYVNNETNLTVVRAYNNTIANNHLINNEVTLLNYNSYIFDKIIPS